MSAFMAKRSSMTFFSARNDQYSHRVRIVLAEKGVAYDIQYVDSDSGAAASNLADVNPYCSVPTLVDRDLVLYEPNVVMEYLDERFPHPPLLPVYPVTRAQGRLFMHRIQKDWCTLVDCIEKPPANDSGAADTARKKLREGLVGIAPIFEEKPYFMSEEFTLVDCCVAPILWRLPRLGIKLGPNQGKLTEYANRLFARESFQNSLSDIEKEMGGY